MKLIDYFAIVCVLLFIFGGGVPSPPDRAVVVYESEGYTVPPFVQSVLRDSGIDSTVIDQDVVTGDGKTPESVAAAIAAAQENGLPAIVLLNGLKVLTVFDVPATAEQLQEAIR
tara:strand:+ start:392 stop:733 length:342 start_codon:yes stop_codon:yes gene_type:complete